MWLWVKVKAGARVRVVVRVRRQRVAPLHELCGVRAEDAEPRAQLRKLRAEQRHLYRRDVREIHGGDIGWYARRYGGGMGEVWGRYAR